jgi:transcription elongation factor Elf1
VGNPNLDIEKRTQAFSAHGDVTKHIKRKHLKHIVEGKVLSCGICGETFLQKMHLQRHAIDAHSTVT